MLDDSLSTIIDTLQELKRMHQLNFEILEQLSAVCGYFLENHVSLPNGEKLSSLLSKAMTLFEEINAKPLSDGFLQRRKSDEDFTEPQIEKYFYKFAVFFYR